LPIACACDLVNVCKHFGNCLIKLHGNLLLDDNAAIQSASKRHIFDGGDVMFPTQFFDLLCELVASLRHDTRGCHLVRMVFERNGIVGRVRDDDAGIFHPGRMKKSAMAKIPTAPVMYAKIRRVRDRMIEFDASIE